MFDFICKTDCSSFDLNIENNVIYILLPKEGKPIKEYILSLQRLEYIVPYPYRIVVVEEQKLQLERKNELNEVYHDAFYTENTHLIAKLKLPNESDCVRLVFGNVLHWDKNGFRNHLRTFTKELKLAEDEFLTVVKMDKEKLKGSSVLNVIDAVAQVKARYKSYGQNIVSVTLGEYKCKPKGRPCQTKYDVYCKYDGNEEMIPMYFPRNIYRLLYILQMIAASAYSNKTEGGLPRINLIPKKNQDIIKDWAKKVSTHLNIPEGTCSFLIDNFLDVLRETIYSFDAKRTDPALCNNYYCKIIKPRTNDNLLHFLYDIPIDIPEELIQYGQELRNIVESNAIIYCEEHSNKKKNIKQGNYPLNDTVH